MFALLVIAAIASSATMASNARPQLRLQPATPWVVDYAEDSCRLARNFGEGKQMVTLALDQFEPGDEFRMMFIGDLMRAAANSRSSEPTTLRFALSEAASEFTAFAGEAGERPALVVGGTQRLAPLTKAERAQKDEAHRRSTRFDPAPIDKAREAAVTSLELKLGLPNDLVLETGPMERPLAALRQCSWDMVAHWGIDVEQQRTLTRKVQPRQSPVSWIKASDYPAVMLRDGKQGIVNFRLMVDAAGRPTSCHIQTSTRPKAFDDIVCRSMMRRAKFHPALDAHGQPVPSYYRETATFRFM